MRPVWCAVAFVLLLVPPLVATSAAQVADAQPASGRLEGRPAPVDASPLQTLVDEAPSGARLVVPAGAYQGDLYIDKPIALIGDRRPVLVGSGRGSVVRIRAAGVTLEGFDIDGRRGGDLGAIPPASTSPPRTSPSATATSRETLFGIYLREADDAVVERCSIIGIPDRPPGEIGSGIHVWNSQRFRLTDNEIVGTRDGMYIQSSSHGVVRGNRARELRYGLHYMFSDDNVFEDNSFETGAAGTALMYSKRLVFRRNRFVRNRGFASVGLLLKACDDVLAEDNLIADNARGVFLEGSYRNQFRRNVIAMSDTALVIYDSSGENVFEGNSFVGNLTPLTLVGTPHRHPLRSGNYWSDHGEPDLDGDGIADRPFRLSNVFDHVRGNLTAADLFAHGVAAAALGAAERAFPVLDPIPVVDERPLARPPDLPLVPSDAAVISHQDGGGAALAVAAPRCRRRRARVRAARLEDAVIRYQRLHQGVWRSQRSSTVSRSRCRRATSSRSSARTALARRPRSRRRPASSTRRRARWWSAPRAWRPPMRGPASRVSFLPQRVSFPETLTGREVVEFYRRLRGGAGRSGRRVLKFASLNGAGARAVGHLLGRNGAAARPGGGEPAADRRPAARRADRRARSRRAVRVLRSHRGAARRRAARCFFSSHQLGDVERLADLMAVIVHGRLAAVLTERELAAKLADRGLMRVRLASRVDGLLERLRALSPKALWHGEELILPGPASARPQMLDVIRAAGGEIRGLTAEEGRLDQFYRELVGGQS